MTVTTTHSDTATPQNPGTQDLIAEISPAMRWKLRLDTRLQMLFTGQFIITSGILSIRTEGVGIPLGAGVVAMGIVCVGLGVFYADKLAIHGELKYRRARQMALGALTVTISGPHDTNHQPVAVSFDDVLIGEMPPAMRAKLETDGKVFGWFVGLVASIFCVYFEYSMLPVLLGESPTLDTIGARLIRHAIQALAFLLLIMLPIIMKRLNVRREIKFRRQHGKWRWER